MKDKTSNMNVLNGTRPTSLSNHTKVQASQLSDDVCEKRVHRLPPDSSVDGGCPPSPQSDRDSGVCSQRSSTELSDLTFSDCEDNRFSGDMTEKPSEDIQSDAGAGKKLDAGKNANDLQAHDLDLDQENIENRMKKVGLSGPVVCPPPGTNNKSEPESPKGNAKVKDLDFDLDLSSLKISDDHEVSAGKAEGGEKGEYLQYDLDLSPPKVSDDCDLDQKVARSPEDGDAAPGGPDYVLEDAIDRLNIAGQESEGDSELFDDRGGIKRSIKKSDQQPAQDDGDDQPGKKRRQRRPPDTRPPPNGNFVRMPPNVTSPPDVYAFDMEDNRLPDMQTAFGRGAQLQNQSFGSRNIDVAAMSPPNGSSGLQVVPPPGYVSPHQGALSSPMSQYQGVVSPPQFRASQAEQVQMRYSNAQQNMGLPSYLTPGQSPSGQSPLRSPAGSASSGYGSPLQRVPSVGSTSICDSLPSEVDTDGTMPEKSIDEQAIQRIMADLIASSPEYAKSIPSPESSVGSPAAAALSPAGAQSPAAAQSPAVPSYQSQDYRPSAPPQGYKSPQTAGEGRRNVNVQGPPTTMPPQSFGQFSGPPQSVSSAQFSAPPPECRPRIPSASESASGQRSRQSSTGSNTSGPPTAQPPPVASYVTGPPGEVPSSPESVFIQSPYNRKRCGIYSSFGDSSSSISSNDSEKAQAVPVSTASSMQVVGGQSAGYQVGYHRSDSEKAQAVPQVSAASSMQGGVGQTPGYQVGYQRVATTASTFIDLTSPAATYTQSSSGSNRSPFAVKQPVPSPPDSSSSSSSSSSFSTSTHPRSYHMPPTPLSPQGKFAFNVGSTGAGLTTTTTIETNNGGSTTTTTTTTTDNANPALLRNPPVPSLQAQNPYYQTNQPNPHSQMLPNFLNGHHITAYPTHIVDNKGNRISMEDVVEVEDEENGGVVEVEEAENYSMDTVLPPEILCQLYDENGVWKQDEEGDTFLHSLSWVDNEDTAVENLRSVSNGPRFDVALNAYNKRNETPLYCAVCMKRRKLVDGFRQLGANINLECGFLPQSHMPIHYAVEQSNLSMVEALLNFPYIDINARRSSDKLTALMIALLHHQSTFGTKREHNTRAIIEKIVDHIVNDEDNKGMELVDQRSGKTPLMMAVETKDPKVVNFIVGRVGVDKARKLINMQNKAGNSCVHLAAGLRGLDDFAKGMLLQMLIMAGGDTNKKNNEGDTARDWARSIIEQFLKFK